MPYFDRFDICAAYWSLEKNHHPSGLSEEWPNKTGDQLRRMNYKPGLSVTDGILSDNAAAIYDLLVTRYGLP